MGYSEVLNLEATDTTAALRAGPGTTDVLLSIKDSAHTSEILFFVEGPRDASTAHECVPRHSQKNDQDWREALAQCVDAIRDLRGIRVPTAVQARSAWRAHGLGTRIAGIVGLC